MDLQPLVQGLNEQDAFHPQLKVLRRYISTAITLPALRVRPEPYRRDSRNYNMPGLDEPLEAVRLSLIMDDARSGGRSQTGIPQSEVWRILDVWRRLVRTGRGALGSESSVLLNANYSIVFRFPIYVYLCGGNTATASTVTSQASSLDAGSPSRQATFDNTASSRNISQQTQVSATDVTAIDGLEVTNVICLENAWLGDFKVGDLTYEQAKYLTIEATIYPENILQFGPGNPLPSTL